MYMSGTLEYYFLKLPGSLLPIGGEKLAVVSRKHHQLCFQRHLENKGCFQPLCKAVSKTKAGFDPGSKSATVLWVLLDSRLTGA